MYWFGVFRFEISASSYYKLASMYMQYQVQAMLPMLPTSVLFALNFKQKQSPKFLLQSNIWSNVKITKLWN